eukprot:scaffold71372_cov42-Phaeocystis_antarctica.AAC.1
MPGVLAGGRAGAAWCSDAARRISSVVERAWLGVRARCGARLDRACRFGGLSLCEGLRAADALVIRRARSTVVHVVLRAGYASC